jgi:hypothetical protein
MQDCNPDGWVIMLRKIIASARDIFIQRHGSVETNQDIKLLDIFINLLRKWIVESEKLEKSIEDILQMELLEHYNTWSVGSYRHKINCQNLILYIA